jgi:pimeloyl-ACP methyl ester carboxylesterase
MLHWSCWLVPGEEIMLGWMIMALLVIILIAAAMGVYLAWTTGRKVEKLVPPLGRFVEVDGAKLHYVDRGEGRPIVLIHGIGGNLRHFTGTILDELAMTNRVIAFDRPGCGYSERPAGTGASSEAQAAIIQKAIDALGIAEPLVAGHSLGGSIALAHAVFQRGKARGYVLIAPRATDRGPVPPMFKAMAVKSPVLHYLIAWTIGIPLSIRRGLEITRAVFAPQEPPADFGKASGGLLSLRPKSIIANFKDFAASNVTVRRIRDRYGEIEAPAIVLFGMEDQVLRPEIELAALETLPSAETQRLAGAGHMLMHVEGPAVIAAIRKLDAQTSGESRAAAAS